MNESSLNATEIAVGSLLAGGRGGYGGYGGGGGGAWGGYGGQIGGPYTNLSTIQHGIERNAQEVENQSDCTRGIVESGFNSISNGLRSAERSRQFGDIKDGQFQSELRDSDRMRDIANAAADHSAAIAACCCQTQLGMKDIALEQQKCCCDTQLSFKDVALEQQKCCCETEKLVMVENQKTRDLINDNTIRAAVDANNITATVSGINNNANANTAAIIAAIQASGHHPHHPRG